MAITVDWENKVINVPKADTTLISAGPPEIRELNVESFRNELHTLQASAEGMPFDQIFIHNASVTVAGITLARVIEIINDYTVTFEDGNYQVNLVGANHNVSDVTNLNSVGLRTANSAGLIEASTSGLTPTESQTLARLLDLLEADQTISPDEHTFLLKNTTTILQRKTVSGSQLPANTNITLTDNTP